MKVILGIFLIMISLVSFVYNLEARDAKILHREGINYLKSDNNAFAFFKFKTIIRDYPNSKYAEEAQVRIIEYLFNHNISFETIEEIKKYYDFFPQGKHANRVREYHKKIN